MHNHITSTPDVCYELPTIGDTVNEENRVVYLLASLHESYNVLVMTLEANAEVPPLAMVPFMKRLGVARCSLLRKGH